MTTSSIYLKSSSNHVDSLIDYINEIKPYRTKLLSVSEEYSFIDYIPLNLSEKQNFTIFMGGDISQYTSSNSISRRSNSWVKEIYSDGITKTYDIPAVSYYKPGGNSNSFKINDQSISETIRNYSICPSGAIGVYKVKHMQGDRPVYVKKNGIDLTFNSENGYFVTEGAFSFCVFPNQLNNLERTWKEYSIKNNENFPSKSGLAVYEDIRNEFGIIKNINYGNNREWVLECVDQNLALLSVKDSTGSIFGTAQKDEMFSLPGEIEFTFSYDEFTTRDIEIGDTFTLTPKNKIVVSSDAGSDEIWTLFKVRNSSKILVHGSITGWALDAEVGKWYFNGSIGFKFKSPNLSIIDINDLSENWYLYEIPEVSNLEIIDESIINVDEEYTISFSNQSMASVHSNKNGFLRSLMIGEEWTDGKIKLTIDSLPSLSTFRLFVSFSTKKYYTYGYDELPYESGTYDHDFEIKDTNQWIYNKDFTDLKNSIVIKNVDLADQVDIRVLSKDDIVFYIYTGGSYVKVDLLYVYKIDDADVVFPKIANKIYAYLANNTDKLVFTISQTVDQVTGVISSTTLEFDDAYFAENLSFTSKFKIAILQDGAYSENVNVGIYENLNVSDETFSVSPSESQMSTRKINSPAGSGDSVGASFSEKITFILR